jgi:leader peptidase (prepilin peptidase)/N-methyltransferase
MFALYLVLLFLVGLSLGSFLNVCFDRVPRRESIIRPPSHCDACGHGLGWTDLVPLFSWIFLRGRCRYCGGRIPARVPLVELACGLAAAGIGAAAWLAAGRGV